MSGYLLPFSSDDAAISFDAVRDIYKFDCEIRNLIFKNIEKIEIFMRTQIVYYFSHQYGAEGYLQRDNFNEKFDFDQFTKRYQAG